MVQAGIKYCRGDERKVLHVFNQDKQHWCSCFDGLILESMDWTEKPQWYTYRNFQIIPGMVSQFFFF